MLTWLDLQPDDGTMNEFIFMVNEAPVGGYIARAIGESIFREADTLDEVRTNVLDAVRYHFDKEKCASTVENRLDLGVELPEPLPRFIL